MEVKVFGMVNCAGCETVKAVFKQKGIEYHYYDVMHHADMETASKYGVRGVPTVVLTKEDGSQKTITGSKPQDIANILESLEQ